VRIAHPPSLCARAQQGARGEGQHFRAPPEERLDVSRREGQGDSDSTDPAISGDGRFVAFDSTADNLVPGDTNGTSDVFVRDLVAGTTTRINVASDGTQADDFSFALGEFGAISDNGQLVVFESNADNLAPGAVSGGTNVFLRDTAAGTTSLLSVSSTGGEGNGDSFGAVISGDGSTAAFSSSATNLAFAADMNGHKDDVFVRDVAAGTTRVVSETDEQKLGTHDSSNSKALSDDGRFLAYRSFANNLVKGDTNHVSDVFLTDLVNGGTIRASVSTTGGQANGDSANAFISGDGRFVGFQSFATNLVPGDTNGTSDVFVRGPMF
jgi:hypothetical protein